ncbi:MAG: hypothetical protein Q8K82_15960 [Gemmatimonadaceae bacterium]|nr:hypothetical protein [Gemmatimonadaceae bacterium]
MPNALRIALALIVGLVVGSGVNMALVLLGPSLIAPPAGADMTTAEGLKAALPLLEPKHFLMPFVAHAAGTWAGALVGSLIAVTKRTVVAYTIGAVFLCGGIAASFMIPAPAWFIVLDLAVAYLPMAYLGLSLAHRLKPAAAA